MKYFGKEREVKVETKRELEYIRCDVCSEKIEGKYYSITTSHNDWGNDSIESIEYADICLNCILKSVKNNLKNGKNSYTDKIEIEAEYFRKGTFEYYNKHENELVEETDIKKRGD